MGRRESATPTPAAMKKRGQRAKAREKSASQISVEELATPPTPAALRKRRQRERERLHPEPTPDKRRKAQSPATECNNGVSEGSAVRRRLFSELGGLESDFHRGLPNNTGTMCFLSSAVVVMSAVYRRQSEVRGTVHSLLDGIREFLTCRTVLAQDGYYMSERVLETVSESFPTMFPDIRNERDDAGTVVTCVLGAIKEELGVYYSPFDIVVQRSLLCDTCGHSNLRQPYAEPVIVVTPRLTDTHLYVQQVVDETFHKIEVTEADCEQCSNSRQPGYITTSPANIAAMIVIHIQRQLRTVEGEEVKSAVAVRLEFRSIKVCGTVYDLKGICTHIGEEKDRGHWRGAVKVTTVISEYLVMMHQCVTMVR